MKMPTDVLRAEHDVILRALDTLEAAARSLRAGGGPDDAWWKDAVEWLRSFADRNHHAKEEASLFPALVKAGVPNEGGPVGVMLSEHVQGRAFIQAIEMGAGASRAEAAQRYVQLLRAHIDKENNVLFMMADGILDEQVQRELARQFEAVEVEQGRAASIPDAEQRLNRLAAAAS